MTQKETKGSQKDDTKKEQDDARKATRRRHKWRRDGLHFCFKLKRQG